MAGARKPAERRQGRGTQDLATTTVTPELVTGGQAPPKASSKWLLEVRRQWDDVWADSSPVAQHIQSTDLPGLRRLFAWRDEQIRARRRAAQLWRKADAEPLVKGSKGQPVPNGLYDIAQRIEASALAIEIRIVALEDRLGLNPKARLALGLTQLQGMSLAAQNAALAASIAEAERAPDPRALPGDPPAPAR